MSEEILINVNPFETRVALLDQGALQEIHLHRTAAASVTGNIYKGRIDRVLPGMQAAFVDIGLARPGFLHLRDLHQYRSLQAQLGGSNLPSDSVRRAPTGGTGSKSNKSEADELANVDIREFLSEGQSILVEVSKDPLSNKGARLTSDLAIASRFLVLMPFTSHVGVSQRIEDSGERERLRELTASVLPRSVTGEPLCGLIVRTAAEGVGVEALATDVQFLQRVWERVRERDHAVEAPALVYEELPAHIRMIRDVVGSELRSVRIDCAQTYDRVANFVEQFVPEHRERLERHVGRAPIFEQFGIEQEINRSLSDKVLLKCGGHLVIEQTEAMTTIDVNTGAYVGSKNLSETVFRTNMEAAAVIPRQLRLRNLGGIVIVDFIDMEDAHHQEQVLEVLNRHFEGDSARVRVGTFSALGLVELSRKRTRESLGRQMGSTCERCHGRGSVKSPQSMCYDILRAILADANRRLEEPPDREYVVRASADVVDRLLDEEADHVREVSEQTNRAIRFQVEPAYGNEQYDLVLIQRVSERES